MKRRRTLAERAERYARNAPPGARGWAFQGYEAGRRAGLRARPSEKDVLVKAVASQPGIYGIDRDNLVAAIRECYRRKRK